MTVIRLSADPIGYIELANILHLVQSMSKCNNLINDVDDFWKVFADAAFA